MLETLLYERRAGVGVLTLNRPSRKNAINTRMLGEFLTVLDEIDADPETSVLVVTGAEGSFCSGFDLQEQMERRPVGVGTWRDILRKDFDGIMRFWSLTKPVIAAVEGYCLAAGFELALACDITFAASNAVFGEPELKFGAGIVVMLLPWIVGAKRAKEIILSGADDIGAHAAFEMGIVNRVVEPGEVLTRSMELGRRIATIDPGLLRQTKRALNRTFEIMGLGEALEAALDIDLHIEGEGIAAKREFMDIARRDGMRAAIAWRDARFRPAGGE